ncbi:MAG TPA: uridine kinase [Fimbriimonadaceae bacterium]|nr:uridine kinase [Fimbriimonadaceae bacterium]
MPKSVLIGIAGGSGSGKSYLANFLQAQLGSSLVAVLSMDQYFRSRPPGEEISVHEINFDHPAHIEIDLLMADLTSLREGKTVLAPDYDFLTQKQQPNKVRIDPAPVIIVEGLFVLAKPIVELFDLTVFLDVEADQRLIGRILRDLQERGSTVEWAVDRYQRFVRPSYLAFVEPTKQNADVVVDFTYRRAFFQELLLHMVQHYASRDVDVPTLIESIRNDTYNMGIREGRPASTSIDLRSASLVIPEAPPVGPGQGKEPQLWTDGV